MLALCCVVALSGCALESAASPKVKTQLRDRRAEEQPSVSYRDTVAAVTPMRQQDIALYKTQYPDTVGWLTVPGTDIDTVVVQGDDVTNEYYLNHDLEGNPHRDGTYSAHYRCGMVPGTREGISRNITLFAHNHDEDPDGILFAQLKRFKDREFAEAHPYLFFSAMGEDMAWEIFAVFDTVKQFDYIEPDPSWWRMQQIVGHAMEASLYDYGVAVGREDKILTLSTCSFDIPGVGLLSTSVPNDYRYVVMARLVPPGEVRKDTAQLAVREDILLPDDFPTHSDYIHYGGAVYLLMEHVLDHPSIQPVDMSRLELRGVVKRTLHAEEPEDWDASHLPAGTAVYYNPAHPMMFLADVEGELLPYTPVSTEIAEPMSMNLVLQWQGMAVRRLKVDEAVDAVLWPITDMADGFRLEDGEEIRDTGGHERVVLEIQFPFYGVEYEYYLGVPASLGEEVLIVRQYDGVYYKEAALYRELMGLFAS